MSSRTEYPFINGELNFTSGLGSSWPNSENTDLWGFPLFDLTLADGLFRNTSSLRNSLRGEEGVDELGEETAESAFLEGEDTTSRSLTAGKRNLGEADGEDEAGEYEGGDWEDIKGSLMEGKAWGDSGFW